jgi:hypothetical protein
MNDLDMKVRKQFITVSKLTYLGIDVTNKWNAKLKLWKLQSTCQKKWKKF